jgi:hypothetical protein
MNFSPALKKAGEKTWNVYSVFLCAAGAVEDEARAIRWIEEDLQRTRKVTGLVPNGRGDMVTALLPLPMSLGSASRTSRRFFADP